MAVGIQPTPAGGVDDDLYREIILDHFRHPRHRGEIDSPTARVEANNPLCGDEVCLTWQIAEDRISAIGFTGRGCSICMASASMLCEALTGARVADALATTGAFRAMLLEGASGANLGDLEALSGVAAYPVRIKCAVLAWNALLQDMAGAVDGAAS